MIEKGRLVKFEAKGKAVRNFVYISGEGKITFAVDDSNDPNYVTVDNQRMTQAEYQALKAQADGRDTFIHVTRLR